MMPLRGIKVVEFAGLAPAPFCGMVLQNFGASVTRIDKVGSYTSLDCLGNGKKSIALNLKHPKGIEIARKLCANSDVLIEPFRKGVMESLGLGPDALLKENSRLIYARLTGYGQYGPYSHKAGHDINYLATSGLLSTFGPSDRPPTIPVNMVADFGGGGLMCSLGILLAIIERQKSNLGQIIDANMVQGTAFLGSYLFRSPHIWGNPRGCNYLDGGGAFYQNYETKDGKFIAVGAIEPQFYDALLEGLGLTHDEAPQGDQSGKLQKLFTEKFRSKTRDQWVEIFKDLDACVTPVLTMEEAAAHEHNVAQGTFAKDPEEGVFVPKTTPVLSRTPGVSSAELVKCNIGEHTKLVLKELGYSEGQIVGFEKDSAVESHLNSKL